MAQHDQPEKALPNPKETEIARHQSLAIAVIEAGDLPGDRAKVAREHGVGRYLVTRAMQTQGDWARAEVKRRRRAAKASSKAAKQMGASLQ